MTFEWLTLDPLAGAPVLAAAAAASVILAVVRLRRGAARADVAASTVLIAALLVAALDPATGGGTVRAGGRDVDVLFVVDTTGSIGAEDYAGQHPRLVGVKSDMAAIADEYRGARFALIRFDSAARLDLPWTTDGGALATAIDVLDRELTVYSSGSQLDVAVDMIDEQLERAARRQAERGEHRPLVLYFFSDGEVTEPGGRRSFDGIGERLAGGAVFGYGTPSGARMTYSYGAGGTERQYIYDFVAGDYAISRIDEGNLRAIAEELGVEYLHRQAPGDVDGVVTDVKVDGAGAERVGARRWYWVAAAVVVVAGAWQSWRLAAAVVEARHWGAVGGRR